MSTEGPILLRPSEARRASEEIVALVAKIIAGAAREAFAPVVREMVATLKASGRVDAAAEAPHVDPLLSVRDAADRLRVSPKTVRSWIASGRLDAAQVGREFRISEAELARFLAGRTKGRAAEESPDAIAKRLIERGRATSRARARSTEGG